MIFNTHYPYIGGGGGGGVPKFTYTGQYIFIDDGSGNWRIKFLTSGVLTFLKDVLVDVFLVGAGGGGKGAASVKAGGGSGYTKTVKSIAIAKNTQYAIEIGVSGESIDGGSTSAFNATAEGGKVGGSSFGNGGNGGSGGGGFGAAGGIDGANGSTNSLYRGGTGQGTTTREFGEPTGNLYASGGSGVSSGATAGADNTGDGGDNGKAGGSGIVIIRNAR